MLNQIKEDLKKAMLAKDTLRVSTLRMTVTALTNEAISKGAGYELSKAECDVVFKRMIKSREDSAQQYKDAGRTDQMNAELGEIGILLGYLPKQMSQDEILNAVLEVIKATGATTKKDMGKVMKELTSHYGSSLDAKAASKLVQENLA